MFYAVVCVYPSRARLCSNIEEDGEEESKLPVNMGSFLPDKVVSCNSLSSPDVAGTP